MSEHGDEPGTSRTSGGCVLTALAALVFAVIFAASTEAGILTIWTAATAAIWWATRRRMSDSSATPPPRGATPPPRIPAGHEPETAKGVQDPIGVMRTYHPPANQPPKNRTRP